MPDFMEGWKVDCRSNRSLSIFTALQTEEKKSITVSEKKIVWLTDDNTVNCSPTTQNRHRKTLPCWSSPHIGQNHGFREFFKLLPTVCFELGECTYMNALKPFLFLPYIKISTPPDDMTGKFLSSDVQMMSSGASSTLQAI